MPHARSTAVRPPITGKSPDHTLRVVPRVLGSYHKLPIWLTFKSWQGRFFWLLFLIGPIWLLDKPLFDLQLHERKVLLLGDLRDATRQFGEPMGIAWIGLVLWFLDPSRRRPLVIALVATLIASGLGSGAKLLIGRERPRVADGRTVIRGAHWPGEMNPDPSFPSGHTTVAFAFAFGLSRMYGKHRRLWLVLASGCGLSRALGEAHFLTDVLVGAWMGWEIARILWDRVFGPWLRRRGDRGIPRASWLPAWDWTNAAPLARAAK